MYRTVFRAALTATALLLLAAGPVVAQEDDMGADQPDIVDTAVEAEDFSTLVQALKAADLVEALKGDGPFTVFAPTDEAFAALPDGQLESLLQPENKSQLQAILKYHVVPAKAPASKVTGMSEAKTLQGMMVGIEAGDDGVQLTGKNSAMVTSTDVMASNGVIHVIDTVLLPPEEETEESSGGGYR